MTQIFTNIPFEEFKTVLSQAVKTEVEKINLFKPEPEPEFITRKEAARILGISLVTLNEWTKQGLTPAYRIGTRVRYKKEELIESLKQVQSVKYKRR
jgi:excisionase family DNA binding protein